MELVTMHTHTNYTGHGHGTVAELVDAAEAAKLRPTGNGRRSVVPGGDTAPQRPAQQAVRGLGKHGAAMGESM